MRSVIGLFDNLACDILDYAGSLGLPCKKLSANRSDGPLFHRVMRLALLIPAGLVLGYLALLAYVYVKQTGMLYLPSEEIEATPRDIGLDYKELTLITEDGVEIAAWHVPAEQSRGVLLFCHGNAGNISHRLDSIRIFHDLGLDVFIFDYRGYGKSRGSPDEEGTYRDAEAARDYLVTDLRVNPEKIVLFGRSLGGAVAAEIALRRRAGALIIESGFTSVPDLGKKFFPYLPVALLSRFNYSSIDKVGNVKIPKLFIHSPGDEIVPYDQGVKLFEKAQEPKEFLSISGGHNEGFLASGRTYKDGLEAFLTKYF